MPYQTGVPTSPTNLLQTLATWLTGLGWTSDMGATDGSGYRAHLHNNGVYAHMRASVNESIFSGSAGPGYGIGLYLSTSFLNTSAWNQQPGSPPYQNGSVVNVAGVELNLTAGPYSNYYFFADATADNIVVVVEKSSGIYSHMAWGKSLTKLGAWTGGMYFVASSGFASGGTQSTLVAGIAYTADCPGSFADGFGNQSGYVRADVDTFTGKWIGLGNQAVAASGYTGKHMASPLPTTLGGIPTDIVIYANQKTGTILFVNQQTSSIDGRANLLPVVMWAARDAGGYSPIGSIPNIFYSNGVGNGFANAAIYPLGAQNYMLFPNFAVLKQ